MNAITKTKKRFSRLVLFFILLLQQLNGFSQADLILYNGKIFTTDKKHLWVEAVAIKSDRIIATGKKTDVLKLRNSATKLIDLKNHLAVPGFNDAHHHEGPSFHNRSFEFKNGAFAPTPWEEARDSIAKIIKEVPAGGLITSKSIPTC